MKGKLLSVVLSAAMLIGATVPALAAAPAPKAAAKANTTTVKVSVSPSGAGKVYYDIVSDTTDVTDKTYVITEDSVTLKAKAKDDSYKFSKWTKDTKEAGTNGDALKVDYVNGKDTTYAVVAVFNSKLTVKGDANGTVTIGSGTETTGYYAKEQKVDLIVKSKTTNYVFDKWTCDDSSVVLPSAPDATTNKTVFTMGDKPVTLTAVFKEKTEVPDTYALTVKNTTGGSSTVFVGSDTKGTSIAANSSKEVNVAPGSAVKIVAKPETSKMLKSWTGFPKDLVTDAAAKQATVTFKMPKKAISATANFGDIEWTVTIPEKTANGTVTFDGSTAGTTEMKFKDGESAVLKFAPVNGYKLGELKVNGIKQDVTKLQSSKFTISKISKNIIVTVAFIPTGSSVVPPITGNIGDNINNVSKEIEGLLNEITVGEKLTNSAADKQVVDAIKDVATKTVGLMETVKKLGNTTANAAIIAEATDTLKNIDDLIWALPNVNEPNVDNVNVGVEIAGLGLTAKDYENKTLSMSAKITNGTTIAFELKDGTKSIQPKPLVVKFTISNASTYEWANHYIVVGATKVPYQPIPTFVSGDGLSFVMPHFSSVDLSANPVYPPVSSSRNYFSSGGTGSYGYYITATAGANGTISPEGETKYDPGTNATYKITPNAGYVVDKVLIDGTKEVTLTDGTYTFNSIMEPYTISVTFKSASGSTVVPGTPSTTTPAPIAPNPATGDNWFAHLFA